MKRFLWRLGYSLGSNNNMWMLLIWTITFFDTLFNLLVVGFGPAISFDVPLDKEMQENYEIYFHGLRKTGFLNSFTGISWINIFWAILLGVAIATIIISAIIMNRARYAGTRRRAGNVFRLLWKIGLGILVLFILYKIFSLFGDLIGSWFRTWSWNIWFLLVILSLLSLLFLWDEVSRAWEAAYEKITERRGGKVTGPTLVSPVSVVQSFASGAQSVPQAPVSPITTPGFFNRPLSLKGFFLLDFIVEFVTELLGFARRR